MRPVLKTILTVSATQGTPASAFLSHSSSAKYLALFFSLLALREAAAVEPCRIEVTEKGTGWPVPLVELRTTNAIRFVTDNAGVIAFDLPECMGRETWFDVIGHGYEMPKDGFGFRGVRFTPQPGKVQKIEIERKIIAKRIGRFTGSGLFAESQKSGGDVDWHDFPVAGCDSVQNAFYKGKLFWAWGDTILPGYALGIYDMTGATTAPAPLASLVPPLRPSFDYFTDAKGGPRGIAKLSGNGPTWLGALATLPASDGNERLVSTYVKIEGHLDPYECGLSVWNDAISSFERLRVLWRKTDGHPRPPMPDGHAAFWKDAQGKQWVLFGNPFPVLRCPATFEAWQDPATWEPLEAAKNLLSASDGKVVKPHTGAIAWNPWRKSWVTVFMEAFGKPSALGELWYAEAKSPTGPWGKAVKILTHENYTFYNPCLHPEFVPGDSPVLFFEGTYTAEFADHAAPTPRYNYNQILYRLDLDDPALLPAHAP